MALRDDPQNRAGGRGFLRSKNQQAGWPFFWLLFFGHSKKSDSPKATLLQAKIKQVKKYQLKQIEKRKTQPYS